MLKETRTLLLSLAEAHKNLNTERLVQFGKALLAWENAGRPDMLCQDDVLDELLTKLGYELVDHEEFCSAETNCSGWMFSEHDAEYRSNLDGTIDFDADFHYDGEADSDKMFCGDTILASVKGRISKNEENKWVVEDNYEVSFKVKDWR